MSKIYKLLSVGVIATVLSAGMAAAATFTNVTNFNANANVALTEDFQSLGTSTNSSLTGPTTLPSGITVFSQSNNLFTVGPFQSTNPTTAIGSNTPGGDSLTVDLGGSFTAFGVDLFQNGGGGSQFANDILYDINLSLGGSAVNSYSATVAPNGGSFFGLTSAAAFDSVSIFSTANSFEVIDNVLAGDATFAPIPLPAGGFLLFSALAAAAGLGYRRKVAA